MNKKNSQDFLEDDDLEFHDDYENYEEDEGTKEESDRLNRIITISLVSLCVLFGIMMMYALCANFISSLYAPSAFEKITGHQLTYWEYHSLSEDQISRMTIEHKRNDINIDLKGELK